MANHTEAELQAKVDELDQLTQTLVEQRKQFKPSSPNARLITKELAKTNEQLRDTFDRLLRLRNLNRLT